MRPTRDQIHHSLEGHQGASEIRYQTFSEKQTTPFPIPSSLPPSSTRSLPSPCTPAHSYIHPSALHGVLGVLLIFKIIKDVKQHFPQQGGVPIITDLSHCLLTRANHTSSLMKIPDCSPHPPCLALPMPPRWEQHPPAPVATSHMAPP